MPVVNPPLKWHGGKHYLASKIIDLMPPHLHYVEPYFGGGAVLLAKDPEGISEVVNDLNPHLTNFWRVLSDTETFERFVRVIESIPFSQSSWDQSAEVVSRPCEGTIYDATSFFICCRQSLAGRMQIFAPLSRTRTRRGMNEQASAWLNAIEGLPEVHARLKRVVILNCSALDVIRDQDGPQTLFYLDPPYLHETRSTTKEYGAFEMDRKAHILLLALLSTKNFLGIEEKVCCSNEFIKEYYANLAYKPRGKFMLSGYRSDLYNKSAKCNCWNRHEFSLPNNAAGGKNKRRMTEVLWCNF